MVLTERQSLIRECQGHIYLTVRSRMETESEAEKTRMLKIDRSKNGVGKP